MQTVIESTWLRLALVVPVAVTLQLSLISELRLLGATGDILLLFALVGAMITGPHRGAVFAFVIGLAFDLFLQTPFALSALAYCLAASIVGRVHNSLYRELWWFSPFTVFVGSVGSVTVWVLIGTLFGVRGLLTGHLVGILLVVSGLNAVLAPAALRIMRWVLAAERPSHQPA